MSRRHPQRKRSQSRTPPAGSGTAHITIWLTRPGSETCEHIRPARISDVVKEPDTLLWVDLKDPGPADLEMLREEFGFHRLALEDVAKQRQRPKVDEYGEYFFVVIYAPLTGEQGEELRTAEVDLFVGKNYVVTIHRGDIPSIQDAVTRWERTDPDLRQQVGFLLHTIADSVIDAYFPIVDAMEDRLDELELSLFTSGQRFDAEELLAAKRSLYTLRKVIYPLREVFNTFLRRDQVIFSAETYPYFQDSYDHVLRLLDIIDIERDMATGALEAQLSVASNRLNETVKRLTVIAICVAILGAVFGAWGMNFTAVPMDKLGLTGFAIVVSGTLALIGLVLIVARRLEFW
jgi:magnesium transporter